MISDPPVPRYVAVLVGAALIAAGVHAAWLVRDTGPAPAVSVARLLVYLVGAWGLWRLRRWARLLAMAYLAAELTAFLLFGAAGWREFIGLHILMVPFATFSFMYLQRGAKDFR